MKRIKYLVLAGAATGLVALSACNNKQANGQEKVKAIDVSLLDSTVKPADDFFHFVNNKWIKANPIPADKSSWGAFYELDEQSVTAMRKVLEDAANSKDAEQGSNTQLLGAYYRAAMDTVGIEKAGLEPLKGWLALADSFGTPQSVAKLLSTATNSGFLGLWVDQDQKNSSQYTLYLSQGGLGLPDRDYYFRKDAKSEETRTKYKEYIAKILELSGQTPEEAKKNAATVYSIDEKLATASMPLVEQRDPYKVYNPYTVADWKAKNKNIDWDMFLKMSGVPASATQIVVGQPKFFSALDGYLKSIPAAEWKQYVRFHIISDNAEYLSKSFSTAHFDFYDKFLRGKEKEQPRWKTSVELANYIMRDILGQEYVKVKFSENAKKRALEMVNNLKAALGKRIDGLAWMSPETKKKAHEKLDKIIVKIGYPDKWRDYKGLAMKDGHWWYNLQAGFSFEQKRMMSRLGKQVDKTEWLMGPQEVNAYYNPTINEIVFPAAILQPPFFNEYADDAVNYGGIGMVIGHELTHGFDDQGRQYDANGNLTDWWTKEDADKYIALTQVFVKQYNGYVAVDTVHVNGDLTLGENIADLGGCVIAFEAMKAANKNTEKIDGFTPEQRFFLSLAQIWRSSYRPEALRNMVFTNPHSPPVFRVNGVVTNMQEFYDAFGVKEGDKLYRPKADRAQMW